MFLNLQITFLQFSSTDFQCVSRLQTFELQWIHSVEKELWQETYQVTEQELIDKGVHVVIYANHLLRAAYPAMMEAAHSILEHGRSKEIDSKLLSIKDILELIPGTK